ncbi:MAG: ATP phosphoribosyltransferase [Alphaproteobacteria bacterium]|nr:ATP phosphoribosyltransferase [Alphaproteobacteria bacterium]MBV9693063.1 ATP phosphoribosyltransferase [Alphaproteobacteria bacterium]
MTLTLAIPSKGRLQEQAGAYFADAGLALHPCTGSRGYRATMAGLPDVDVRLVSAAEIAVGLAAGDFHLGVTGEDLIRETGPDASSRVALLHALGFGFANVVVAVPRAWIDVATMADLDDVCAAFAQRHKRRLRIATKYVHLTRRFFAEAGISDYRIVESAGATEGAPAAGAAEAIVDIATTGATLAANGLKTLDDGTILESQAQLAAASRAEWDAHALVAARALLKRLWARELAKASHVLRTTLHGDDLVARAGASVLSRGGSEMSLLVPRAGLMQAVEVLGSAAVADVEYVFNGGEPLYERLTRAIAATPARP